MDDIVTAELQIRNLGESVKMAMAQRLDEYRAMVDASVDRLIESGELEKIVDREVRKSVESAFSQALNDWDVRLGIKDLIKKRLKESDE